MLREKLKKLTLLFLTLVILSSTLSLSGINIVLAEETGTNTPSTTPSSNVMARNMLEFFQTDRATIVPDNVDRNEIIVYGIFLSNFFKPWSTTIGDLTSDEGDKSIPKEVSKRFFGSDGQVQSVIGLNKKLQDAITNSIGMDSKTYALYSEKPNDASTPMSGKDLYKKINGADKERIIFGQNGMEYMDLNDPATKAVMKILYGIEPDMWTSKDKGLSKITAMYIDGLGNIWGAYDGAAVVDYVLILPAVLNPRVYAKGGETSFKFPMSNTFVMGANLKIDKATLDTNKDTFMTPYYNVPEKSTSKYDKKNLVNVYGVYSYSQYIGRSDRIITDDGVKENIFATQGENFLNEDSTNLKSKQNARIIVSMNTNTLDEFSYIFTDLFSDGYSDDERMEFLKYFLTSSILTMEQISDEMYYFTNPLVTEEYNIGTNSAGQFDKFEDLITPSNMFTIPQEDGIKFHTNSSIDSPFLSFIKGYRASDNPDEYLKNYGVDTNSKNLEYLKNFLDTGVWGTDDMELVGNTMKLLFGGKKAAYSLLEPKTNVRNIVVGSVLPAGWVPNNTEMIGASLTIEDYHIMYNSGDIGLVETYSKPKDVLPFFTGDYGNSMLLGKNPEGGTHEYKVSAYFHNFMTYRIFGMHSEIAGRLTGTPSGEGDFKTPWDGAYNTNTAIMDDVNNYAGMYWGLMVSLLGIKENADGTGFTKPIPFSNPHIPPMEIDVYGSLDLNASIGTAGLVSSEDATKEQMQEDILKKVYGMLQDGPSTVRENIVKSFLESWVISTHRSIVGTWTDPLSVSAGSGGSYASSVNFLSMPTLAELPLTDWLLDDYLYVYLFLMLIVLSLLVLMYLTNRRTITEVVLVGVFLAVVLILPQYLINNVLQISNKVTDYMYSDKFDYWAIVQHQQSKKSITSARITGSELDYIAANSMQDAEMVYSKDAGVRLKWMSPKKRDNFKSIFNESTSSKELLNSLKIFRWLFNSQLNQEEYVYDDPLATYVYRPYVSIARDAELSYSILRNEETKPREILDRVLLEQSTMLGIPEYRFNLYKKNGSTITYSKEQQKMVDEVKTYLSSSQIEGVDNYRYWALGNSDVTDAIFRTDYSTNAGLDLVTNEDNPYYNAFLLQTESPFYYFYNVFKTRYTYSGAEFKDSLLNKDLFVVTSENTQVNGTIRDFLDMEGLFTYVIPYLHQSNEYVYGWTDLYGSSIEGYNFDTGVAPTVPDENDPTVTKEERARLQYLADKYTQEAEKKAKLENVWMMYTPWVDAIYDIPNAYGAKAKVAEKSVNIPDSLNPGSYEEQGRAMIFSEADMRAKSYRYSDLTDIERRIQAVLDKTHEDLLYLVNYYDFDNEVLLAAAAMTATFNFNAEFSSTTLVGEGVTLYPQNYEMKNFNYDAFMRLILLNSTGEPLIDTKGGDLYVNILSKTSIVTGIMLIICDILGVIVIPAIKILAVFLLLLMTLALCLTTVVSPPEKIVQTVIKQIGLPVLYLLLSSIIFAWLIGVFMGDGLETYVGSQSATLSITDPTITMVLLCIADLVYIFILYKICKMLFDSLKSYGTSLVYSSIDLVAQTGSAVASKIRNSVNKHTAKSRHKEMIDALTGSGGDSSGGGSTSGSGGYGGGGSNGGGSSSGNMLKTLERQQMSGGAGPDGLGDSAVLDSPGTRMFNDIDELASTSNAVSSENPPRRTMGDRFRTVGEKAIDFKVGLSHAKFKALEARDYVSSGRLSADTRDIANKGLEKVNNTVSNQYGRATKKVGETYVKVSEAMSHLKQYEKDRQDKLGAKIHQSSLATQQTKTKSLTRVNNRSSSLSNSNALARRRRSRVLEKYSK